MTTQSDFQITPDEDSLGALERDLRFHPAPDRTPSTLTVEQVQSYNTDGFVRSLDVYAEAEITAIRHYFDRLLEVVIAAGGDSYSISTSHMKNAGV